MTMAPTSPSDPRPAQPYTPPSVTLFGSVASETAGPSAFNQLDGVLLGNAGGFIDDDPTS